MFRLVSYSVAKRLALLITSAIVGLAILLAFFMITERSMLLQERQASVRQAVDVAHGLIVHFHDQAIKGKMTEDEAKQRALAALQAPALQRHRIFLGERHASQNGDAPDQARTGWQGPH